ncbi:MAG: mechanosensitive ion channel family protein [Mariprofundaceae bacterium]|nr:mechanosensitive ion channel family protein [Mariprofundaceae bacterium]
MMTTILNTMQDWSFLGIPVNRWLLALLCLFVVIVLQRYLNHALHTWVRDFTSKTRTQLDDILLTAAEKPVSWLILIFGILITLHVLQPPMPFLSVLAVADKIGRLAAIVTSIWFAWRMVDGLGIYFEVKAKETDSPLDDQLIPFVRKTLKIFLSITGVLVVAQNMGYSISGLLASMGIGGIAVAMAAKDTVANVFGSMMILLDRPFTVGDWIKTKDFEGVVEDVGFRSTRVRTFAKTLVNVPNSLMANMVIDNIDARSKRRIKMRIGITYDTTPVQMQTAIEGIERLLREHTGVDQEYLLVKFDEFEDSSLSIFLYYFSSSPVWEEYLQVRQEINMQIMDLLNDLGLEFAFPTRSIQLVSSEEVL